MLIARAKHLNHVITHRESYREALPKGRSATLQASLVGCGINTYDISSPYERAMNHFDLSFRYDFFFCYKLRNCEKHSYRW